MASRLFHVSAALLLLAPTLAFDADFYIYPEDAQPCLYEAVGKTTCQETSPDSQQLNFCLCGNQNNFLTNAAVCIGEDAPGSVDESWDDIVVSCHDSDTPLALSEQQWLDAANGVLPSTTTTSSPAPTSTTTSSTTTSTSDPSPDTPSPDSDSDSGLSTGVVVGIAVGATALGVSLIAGLAFWLFRRRRSNSEEAHPMLNQHGATTFPPTEPSPAFERDAKPVWASGMTPSHSPSNTGSPDMRNSGTASWGSAPSYGWSTVPAAAGGYAGPYAPPLDPVVELPSQTGQGTNAYYEMEGQSTTAESQRAYEMHGSIPQAYGR